MRTLSFELLPDAGSFTPLQLKPTFILNGCFSGWDRWARAHGLPHQVVIRDLHTAFVVHVGQVKYLERYVYEDAGALDVTMSRRIMRDGAQLEVRAVFEAQPGRPVAESSMCVVPLAVLEDSAELAALPAPLPNAYLSLSEPSEIVHEAYPSPFPGVLREIVERGEFLGSFEHPFFVHRQQCEFVDQWFFVEASVFAAASRERMVFEQGAKQPALRRGLSLPLRELDLLYSRPFYLFDQGRARTRAFRAPEGVVFVHELVKDGTPDPHSVVVERF
ncbi:MAG TPA: hypothetical protein VIG99_18900 [Myxococcaceae bacterium]